MTPTGIAILVIFIVFWIISGILSMDLHSRKGYSGGFWVGFLLGYIGLIYSAGLPDVRNKKVVKDGKNETVIVSDEDNDEDEIDPENLPKKNECPNCFSKVSPTDNVCPNCGFKLKK